MTPQEIKNSILQLAIQGKLVEQRPEEGTAEELYLQIQAEARKLIRAGTTKKEKPLPDATEDEKPFDIPDSWLWVHLDSIALSGLGKTLDKAKNTGDYQPYLCSINVYWSGIDLSKVKEARFGQDELSKYKLEKGDLLICEGGDVGRSAIWDSEDTMYYQNALHRVRFYGGISAYFYKYLLECYKGMGIIDAYSKGMTIKHLVQSALNDIWLPLPPLAEQKRIVAKIEELLPYIDRYEQAWSKLEDFNKCFPGDMQKSILQMAIQGKLVEQRPEEGTGEKLYRQIQAEKQKLIKAGTIKKEKPLAEIAEDEKPFDIPESWKWIRLGSVLASTDAGKSPQCNDRPRSGSEWGVIKTTAIQDGYFLEKENKVLPTGFEVQKTQVVHSGDFLITRAGPKNRTGVMCVVDKEPTQVILSDKTVRLCYIKGMVNPYYLRHALSSPAMQYWIVNAMTGMAASQVNISQDKMRLFILPLPPLAEQKRIVAKLEEILPLCEKLK